MSVIPSKMWRLLLTCILQCLLLVVSLTGSQVISDESEEEEKTKPFGIPSRITWERSHVQGRPEPPLPFVSQQVFPHLQFASPTLLTNAPGTDRLFIAERKGKIFSIPNDPSCKQADLFLDVNALVQQLNAKLKQGNHVSLDSVYGLAFHPQFEKNRYCYLCYVVRDKEKKRKQHPQGTRVVRLEVTRSNPPQAIVKTEFEMINWLGGGHNGGCLKFALDGKLFISTGDGSNAFPPDERKAGQDVSNLLSAVLRIDVDHPTKNRPYTIPKDNPFVKQKGARGEIWAYGMRNPWKMSVDRKQGDLWVGDVGWQLWEMIYHVKPGDNYGWSLVEGPQPVHSEYERGPTPVVKATIEIPHSQGASITGGFVYRGKKFPELDGHYIFGDWATRRIWHLPDGGDKKRRHIELVEPSFRIVGFAEKNDGELLMVNYDEGTIHELVRNNITTKQHRFPTKLSETGLYKSVSANQMTTGVIPYSIQSELWSDHATAQRHIALPGQSSVKLYSKKYQERGSRLKELMHFPKNGLLVKTLSLELEAGKPETSQRIETQILHYNGLEWRGYSYRWNKEQTDARLVDAAGATTTFEVKDTNYPGGKREQQWQFSSRTECMRCHNPWAGGKLGFTVAQLNREHHYGDVSDNQIRTLRHIGILKNVVDLPHVSNSFKNIKPHFPAELLPKLASPHDESETIFARGRAYLQTNCAHCHRHEGGGTARIHIDIETPLVKSEAVGTRPTLGTFGVYDAQILSPGDPLRSIMYFRMAKTGPGHMPHLVSTITDQRGLKLIQQWIQHLPKRLELDALLKQLMLLEESIALKQEQLESTYKQNLLARKYALQAGRKSPSHDDITKAAKHAEQYANFQKAARVRRREKLINEILTTPEGALLLAGQLRDEKLPHSITKLIVAKVPSIKNLVVRNLLEPFLPDNKRTKRLGNSFNLKKLLAMPGDPKRGQSLFLSEEGIACRNCHVVGDQGKSLGPELSHIGKKLNRSQILENILQPSKTIDQKYRTWIIETVAGKVYSGILIQKTADTITIRDAQRKEHHFKSTEIEEMTPQQKSLMPELLLREMSPQQVADLLTWLTSLK